MSNHPRIRAVDLFCGGGGLSWGLVQALVRVAMQADQPTEQFIAEHIVLVAVNHDEQAIETHQRNHPWARHFHDDIQNVNPREVFDEPNPDVTILSGGIECTHWSSARGGKPVDDQKRMPAFDFLTWVQKLNPKHVLVENVKEFAQWGEIDENGKPSRSGKVFEQWINSLHALGYAVDWKVLNAADYGDPTSRERLFIMATRDGSPKFPEPTHSEDGRGDTKPWRTAADIIDWSDPGGSIWTRDLEDGRVRPLKYTTMRRIAEGIRRHCDDRLEPFADALDNIGRVDAGDDVDASKFTSVEELRERPVPAWLAPHAAEVLDEPFLVERPAGGTAATPFLSKYYGTSSARPVSAPLDTVTSGGQKFGLCVPTVLGQHSNSVARAVDERPMPTVTAGGKVQLVSPAAFFLRQQSDGVPATPEMPVPTLSGACAVSKIETRTMVMPKNGRQRDIHSNPLYLPETQPHHTVTADPRSSLVTSYLCPLYNGRTGQRPRTRGVERPLMTVPASKTPAGLATPEVVPFIDDYEGPAKSMERPLGTVTSRDRFALVLPEHYPWGLDIHYRMLKPEELAAAQGFPEDYEFRGTKTDIKEQIGNAVPVNTAQALVESLLGSKLPALTDFVDEEPATAPEPASPQGVADD